MSTGSPALERRLTHYRAASGDAIRLLHEKTLTPLECEPGAVLVRRGGTMTDFMIAESGWFVRSRYTRSGRRQIVNFVLPGDLMNPEVLAVTTSDHEISALTAGTVSRIRRNDLHTLVQQDANLGLVLWWSSAQEEGILREHIVRVGRRPAVDRIAHMLLELQRRLSLVEDIDESSFTVPLTQTHIADSLGLSPVHVNRAMRQLMREGAIDYDRSEVTIVNRSELAERVDFTTEHLHLDPLDG
ncbi:MAG: Crp/Fnr family transcriptional regulator [Pseudomonadota bacterium]